MKLKKIEAKDVFLEAVQLLQNNTVYSCDKREYVVYVIKDICLYRLKLHHAQTKKQGKYIVVNFTNKLVENIKCDHIISRQDISSLMKKGLGYHDQQAPNKNKARISFSSGIDVYINKISRQYSIPIAKCTPWETELLKVISDKVEKSNDYKYKNVLSNKHVREALEEVHKDFVVVQIDKANKNIVLMCKKFYLEMLINEIENSVTFQQVSINDGDLFDNISDGQITFHKGNVKRKIPLLYWTTKMHKTPVVSPFITAGNDTILPELSSNGSKYLSKLMKTAHNNDRYHIKDIDNTIYIIDNRSKVKHFG